MFRSACHDPSDDAVLVILLHVYGGCNEHNEVFIVCSNRQVGEVHQLLLGEGGVPPWWDFRTVINRDCGETSVSWVQFH